MHNRFRDILLMRKTGKVISDSSIFDKRLGAYLNNRDYGEVIITATGNPISIVTSKAQNAISAILSFSPKQEGTGDPSPVNIRPFIGKTGAELTRAGKNIINLADIQIPDGSAQYDLWSGTITGRYTLSFTDKDITNVANPTSRFVGITLDGSRIYPSYNQVKNGYIFDGELSSIRIYGNGAYSKATGKVSFQLEVGQTATAYTPYETPTVYPVSWQSEAGTVYGGVLDATTGTLTVTHIISTIDENSGAVIAGIGGLWFVDGINLSDILTGYCGLTACNSYKLHMGAGNTTTAKNNLALYEFCGCTVSGNRTRVFFRDERFETNTELREWLAENPVTITQELAEPITCTLTPTEITLAEGANTLWTDGDSLSVTYKAPKA